VLFEMTDFHGWEAAALWDDVTFRSQALCGYRTARLGEGHQSAQT
jgi:hypothetical protein